MVKKRTIIIMALIIIFLFSSSTIYYFYNLNNYNNGNNDGNTHNHNNNSSLEIDINNGLSIMYIEPHPDDEVYSPGIFPYAYSKGCKIWVVALISVNDVPEQARDDRRQAITWFEDNYLEEYIELDMDRGPDFIKLHHWHNWEWDNETIKAKYKEVIEEKKPDILMTFTPYGSCNLTEHAFISNMITDIWEDLSYEPKPKIYWFINTDQGPRPEPCYEDELFPPTDVLDLNVYSISLNKTYWNAKVEIWQKYASSIPALKALITSEFLENNDKKEYFVRYK